MCLLFLIIFPFKLYAIIDTQCYNISLLLLVYIMAFIIIYTDHTKFYSSSSSSSSYILSLRGSFGHHKWFHNQFPPFFPVLHCPLGLDELQACPFPDVVFPPLPLSASSSSPFHCDLQDGFGQTWRTGDMTIKLQFTSLYEGQDPAGSYCQAMGKVKWTVAPLNACVFYYPPSKATLHQVRRL